MSREQAEDTRRSDASRAAKYWEQLVYCFKLEAKADAAPEDGGAPALDLALCLPPKPLGRRGSLLAEPARARLKERALETPPAPAPELKLAEKRRMSAQVAASAIRSAELARLAAERPPKEAAAPDAPPPEADAPPAETAPAETQAPPAETAPAEPEAPPAETAPAATQAPPADADAGDADLDAAAATLQARMRGRQQRAEAPEAMQVPVKSKHHTRAKYDDSEEEGIPHHPPEPVARTRETLEPAPEPAPPAP